MGKQALEHSSMVTAMAKLMKCMIEFLMMNYTIELFKNHVSKLI